MARKKTGSAATLDDRGLLRMGFGYVGADGKLALSELEKRYMDEKGIAKIKQMKFPKELEDTYFVYRYFRTRGHMVRQASSQELDAHRKDVAHLSEPAAKLHDSRQRIGQASDDASLLRVWSRGVGREEERSELLVKVVNEGWKAGFEGLAKLVMLAHAARKELAVARVAGGQVSMIKVAKFVD